jgi:hypothetical protein
MTVAHWLSDRSANVPARLRRRIQEALGARVERPADQIATLCIDAAESLLSELLARETSGRDVALDLLTVDALATYAFEAASEKPSTLAACATDAAARFAATA